MWRNDRCKSKISPFRRGDGEVRLWTWIKSSKETRKSLRKHVGSFGWLQASYLTTLFSDSLVSSGSRGLYPQWAWTEGTFIGPDVWCRSLMNTISFSLLIVNYYTPWNINKAKSGIALMSFKKKTKSPLTNIYSTSPNLSPMNIGFYANLRE